ncbi:DUF2993 domain-containing protein [Leptolyngbya sp. FACHB-261]|uniref:LmeA family phospholipid-binding protein n=1 Tax=Leptolyngbya sp. FACHB-261 TaxID=2692806 RepID=UPI0016827A86|nr:DUF2993 domain-containing protein [Leptolyngbya sp. FACHB-261]MBD2103100.1 DUF2993 domain-containing protein [Leptolyngbya sp. FACHB-261]
MSQDQPKPEEQAISKAVELGLANQLNDAEHLDVEVRTDLLKAVQGQVASVSISGEGLVTSQDLRIEKIDFQTGEVAINPLSALLGKLELRHATAAVGHVVITEADLNHALNSAYLREQLQNFPLTLQDQDLTLEIEQVQMQLLAENRMAVEAAVRLCGAEQSHFLAFKGLLKLTPQGQSTQVEQIQSLKGQNLPLNLTGALLDKIDELLNLRTIHLDDMVLNLHAMTVTQGQLTLETTAYINQLPSNLKPEP